MKIKKLDKKSDFKLKFAVIGVLILLAVSYRLIPHPANFAPIAAVAIFGGSLLPRKWALTLPLAAMIISDLVIGLHQLILFTWGSFALIALLSNKYMQKINPLSVGSASIAASVLFFVISNFGVWVQGLLYPLTISGFVNCYINALPFFRNTLLGDLVFSAMLFGVYAAVSRYALSQKNILNLVKGR